MRGRERRARFLVDEDVDAVVAEVLASFHFNTVTVPQIGLAGASDDVVFQRARKERRILLTHNGKDLLNDRRFPLHLSTGIIVLPQQYDTDTLGFLMRIVVDVFGPHAELWEKQKIVLSSGGEVVNRLREYDTGRVTQTRYRLSPSRSPEMWSTRGETGPGLTPPSLAADSPAASSGRRRPSGSLDDADVEGRGAVAPLAGFHSA